MQDPPGDTPFTNQSYWDRLAELLCTEHGYEVLALLRHQQVFKGNDFYREDVSRELQERTSEWQAIGPWKPIEEGAETRFIRTGKWDKYLWLEERDVLMPEKEVNTMRVCVVGESVAAGMFFSPHASPSKVLHSILNHEKPKEFEDVEVIDLTRNAMRADLLVNIADTALQLNPDVLVVFAGNNFCRDHTLGHPNDPFPSHSYLKAASKGIPEIVNLYTQSLATATGQTVKTIAHNAARAGVRLIWIIPSTNDAWQRIAPVSWLGGERTAKWHSLFKQGALALEKQSFEDVLEIAKEMETLDQGTCPTTFRLKAEACIGLERFAEAKEAAQMEVDVDGALHRNSFLSPGLQSVVREEIIRGARIYEYEYIDLSSVFTTYTGDLLADERLFVDYCHLTLEGMQVAMTAVAATIHGEPFEQWHQACTPIHPFHLEAHHIARGLFEAAIYTSHMQHILLWKQACSKSIKRFSKALSTSPEIAKVLLDYVRMRHGAVVTELSNSVHDLVASANSLLDFGILQWIHGIDAETIEAICLALEDAGYDGRDLLTHYQLYDKVRLDQGIDLSNPRYLKYFGRDGIVDWDPERGTYRTQPFLRSYWPVLPFAIVAEEGITLECTLVCRLPFAVQSGKDTVRILLNGQEIAQGSVKKTWTRIQFTTSDAPCRDGFNDVEIHWPDLIEEENRFLEAALHSLQLYGTSNWYPVFGEVHSFLLRSPSISGNS